MNLLLEKRLPKNLRYLLESQNKQNDGAINFFFALNQVVNAWLKFKSTLKRVPIKTPRNSIIKLNGYCFFFFIRPGIQSNLGTRARRHLLGSRMSGTLRLFQPD